MINNEEILAMLRNGTAPDEIANNLTEILNTATKAYEAEKKAEEEKIKTRETAIGELEIILDDLSNWFDFYLENSHNPLKDVTAEEAYEAILDYQKLCSHLTSFFSTTRDGVTKSYENINGKLKKSTKDVDEILRDFLKSFDL